MQEGFFLKLFSLFGLFGFDLHACEARSIRNHTPIL